MNLLERALDWALDRLLGAMSKSAAEPERAPGQLDSADVAIQNRASHPPEAHKVRSLTPREDRIVDGAGLGPKVTQMRPPPRKKPSTRYD